MAHQFRIPGWHRITIQGHERLLRFTAGKFFRNARAHFSQRLRDLRLYHRPIRPFAKALIVQSHRASAVPNSGDLCAEILEIDHLLDIAQAIRPIDKIRACERTGPIGPSPSAALSTAAAIPRTTVQVPIACPLRTANGILLAAFTVAAIGLRTGLAFVSTLATSLR